MDAPQQDVKRLRRAIEDAIDHIENGQTAHALIVLKEAVKAL